MKFGVLREISNAVIIECLLMKRYEVLHIAIIKSEFFVMAIILPASV